MTMTNDKIIECVIKAIPYPEHISDIELDDDCVRFTWRTDRFKVSDSGMVEELEDIFLKGSNIAILMERLIKYEYVKLELKDA
ncbi:hypothetical protein LCGC14_2301060 [marine sediment metagenome]|uniref:Uncharacterized protein n=1 Tax=marine sediment metagenome TaxID=412755 RepID=A0A0F9FIF7_9ZZZZ